MAANENTCEATWGLQPIRPICHLGLQSHYMDWLNTVEPHKVGQDNTALPHTPPGLKGMLLH